MYVYIGRHSCLSSFTSCAANQQKIEPNQSVILVDGHYLTLSNDGVMGQSLCNVEHAMLM